MTKAASAVTTIVKFKYSFQQSFRALRLTTTKREHNINFPFTEGGGGGFVGVGVRE